MKKVLLLASLGVMSGCELTPSEPMVSDFNGSSVKVTQYNVLGEGVRSDVTDAEALRICTAGGKRKAEYASTRVIADYTLEHLYLCL